MTNEEKQAAITRVCEILKSHEIEMAVEACGCCSSPWVTFSYQGEVILDDVGLCEFSTKKP